MNDRDASRRPGEPPVDAGQADRLDRYLDGLVRGGHRPEPGLDTALAATARATQGPASADPDEPAVDRTWRDLMARRPRPQLRTNPTSSGSRTPASSVIEGRGADFSPSSSPARLARYRCAQRLKPLRLLTARRGEQARAASTRTSHETLSSPWRGDPESWKGVPSRAGVPASRAGRIRALGDRTLGVVATLALVAVIVMAGTVVWLNAPRAADPPPTLLAGVGATPSPTVAAAVWATPGVDPVLGAIPADAIRPIVQPCTVMPRTIDDVLSTLALPYREQERDPANPPLGIDPFLDRPFLVPDTIAADGRHTGVRIVDLPSGAPVDPGTIEAIATLYGQRMGCTWGAADDRLATEALRSDDALIRLYWHDDSPPDGGLLIGMTLPPETFSTVQARIARDGGNPASLPQVGQPSDRWLWGFRSLPDGRVAAYVAIGSSDAANQYPVTFDAMVGGQLVNGYIVFVYDDGRWLIDEESGPMMG